jgi:hypothetical protein
MARNTECYVDTSAPIAFLDRSDSHHPLYCRLFSDPPLLIASALVAFSIHEFEAGELSKAIAIVKKFAGREGTLADAHGLSIMRDRRIAACWSTDRHLGLTGVRLVV